MTDWANAGRIIRGLHAARAELDVAILDFEHTLAGKYGLLAEFVDLGEGNKLLFFRTRLWFVKPHGKVLLVDSEPEEKNLAAQAMDILLERLEERARGAQA